MDFKFVKKGILATALGLAIIIPVQQIVAADATALLAETKRETSKEIDAKGLINAVAEIQKQDNTQKTIKIETTEEIKFSNQISGKVFVDTPEQYTFVLATPDENSDWVGKVYVDSVVKLVERGEIFSKITSGNVEGYVKTETLVTGKHAVARAREVLELKYPESNVLTLLKEEIEAGFSVGETREEEALRIAAEEAARVAAEQARVEAVKAANRQKGQAVVDYAKQFLGNPYVYGGTSLTRGADCSGFVMSVYRHFGVSLPHSSYGMRRVGYAVNYSEIQPGDIICYPGHVGIYAGNGKIVNAIDEKKDIGMSNARYTRIVAVRRIF